MDKIGNLKNCQQASQLNRSKTFQQGNLKNSIIIHNDDDDDDEYKRYIDAVDDNEFSMMNSPENTKQRRNTISIPLILSNSQDNVGSPYKFRNTLVTRGSQQFSFISNLKKWKESASANQQGKILSEIIEAFRSKIQ